MLKASRLSPMSSINVPPKRQSSASSGSMSLLRMVSPRSSSMSSRPFLLVQQKCAAMAFMPRPPPVTLTITCGTRRTTVASMRSRIAVARCRAALR